MANPYSTPQAAMAEPDAGGATYEPSIFSMSGRLGRMRYFLYSQVVNLLMSVAMLTWGASMALVSKGLVPPLVLAVIPLILAVALFLAVVFGRRRLHDLDKSGWILLLMLVPLVNLGFGLWMLFARGTDGPNSRGVPPQPNSPVVVIGFWVSLVVSIAFSAYIAETVIKDNIAASRSMVFQGRVIPNHGAAEQ